ncbi:hypothetical protein, partial [Vibrio parahaemolyticus]|uniref:hypothetical protein n=1 Tax=Vibrio parahaemolyticus TaxID=670 RepID=UPI001BAE9FBC
MPRETLKPHGFNLTGSANISNKKKGAQNGSAFHVNTTGLFNNLEHLSLEGWSLPPLFLFY